MTRPKNLVGKRFGRLRVLDRSGSDPKTRKALWVCLCDPELGGCGNVTRPLPGEYLTSGDTASCGCLHRDLAAEKGRRKKKDITGQDFGRWWVVCELPERGSKGEVRWLCWCRCSDAQGPHCGSIGVVTGSQLRGGHSQSCGCLSLELMRARAAVTGSAKRVKVCRTCTRVYTATGPQKECSPECRRNFHAQDEARRRGEAALDTLLSSAATELERRLREE